APTQMHESPTRPDDLRQRSAHGAQGTTRIGVVEQPLRNRDVERLEAAAINETLQISGVSDLVANALALARLSVVGQSDHLLRYVDAEHLRSGVAELATVETIAACDVDQSQTAQRADRLQERVGLAEAFPRQRFGQQVVRSEVVVIGGHRVAQRLVEALP